MIYSPRASVLHAARAGIAAAYGAALVTLALTYDDPAVLVVLGLVIAVAAAVSGVGRDEALVDQAVAQAGEGLKSAFNADRSTKDGAQ